MLSTYKNQNNTKTSKSIVHIRIENFISYGDGAKSKRKMRFLDTKGNLVKAYYTYAVLSEDWEKLKSENTFGFQIVNIPSELNFSYTLLTNETDDFVMCDCTPEPSMIAGIRPWKSVPCEQGNGQDFCYTTECVHFDREVVRVIGIPV